MSEGIKTVSVDPLSTAASEQLAAEISSSSSKMPLGGSPEETLDALNALESMDAQDALEAFKELDTMSESEDGFFGNLGNLGNLKSRVPSPKLGGDDETLNMIAKSSSQEDKSAATAATPDPVVKADAEQEEKLSRSPSLESCAMGTDSLISSGCVYTILEQFFRPTIQREDGDLRRENITDSLQTIAKQLTRIANALESKKPQETPADPPTPSEEKEA